jgi:hypothetical protein
VALLPLAAVGVVVMLIRTAWYRRYRWAVLAIGAVGTLGAILAASSGESLESQVRARKGAAAVRAVQDHAEAGDMARNLAILFFFVLALYVFVPWFLERRDSAAAENGGTTARNVSWLRPTLMVAVAVTALASMVSIINAGHSGASRAWEEYKTAGQVVGEPAVQTTSTAP